MGSDLYDVAVERWREGTIEEIVESARGCGMDAAGVRAIIERMGDGERAVELDIYIRQIHPDAAIWCIDHGFMVMTLHAAGYYPAKLEALQQRIEDHFGGFDNINSYDFDAGPQDACFAFSVLEQGSAPGDRGRYGDVPDDFEAPDEDWARVRLWMAWELGRDLQGASWDSRAWVPGQRRMWVNHMPAADTPVLGARRVLDPEVQAVCGLAMAKGRVFVVGEDATEVVCHEVSADDWRWRSEPIEGSQGGESVCVSSDGQRVYVSGRGGAGWLAVEGEGEEVVVWPPCRAASLVEDCEGRVYELQIYDDEAVDEDAPNGAVFERDRDTGARGALVWGTAAELYRYALARLAPVMALPTHDGAPGVVIVERGVARRLELERPALALALSEGGQTLYALVSHEDRVRKLEAWDVASGARLWSDYFYISQAYGGQLAALPGGHTLAIADGGKLHLFDLARRCELYATPISEDYPRGFLHGLTVSAEGDHLLVSVEQREVVVWSLA